MSALVPSPAGKRAAKIFIKLYICIPESLTKHNIVIWGGLSDFRMGCSLGFDSIFLGKGATTTF